ncbi:MAG: gliding motility-associated C-terminal domain-containing protein [Chitinophagaceae bacterium]|jgi:gliding motility-associated-like protein|nr:gliding motility-associated C-terminal domain-containing protein [Chitinophagaceae bacterium]
MKLYRQTSLQEPVEAVLEELRMGICDKWMLKVTYCKVVLYKSIMVLMAWGITMVSEAQLCNGSLGDPVVKIDFGTPSNPQPIPPLSGYLFQAFSCPDDGYYTIASSSPSCFNNSWHVLNTDHSGNGLFLIVNANFTPGDFFLQRITGLCPGTTYEFAAWLMNLIRYIAIKPNLLFNIETTTGTVLQSYNTGDIPETTTPQWNQYGFYFTTPPGISEVVLRIRNNAPGGIGNDVAIDDITFRPCGPQMQAIISGNGDSASGCEGNIIPFPMEANITQGFNNPSFQWQSSRDTGKTWQDITGAVQLTYTATPSLAGSNLYRIAAAESGNLNQPNCRIASEPISIFLRPLPEADAGPDRSIFPGDTITIQATASGSDLSYSWSPAIGLSDASLLNPRCFTNIQQTYTLTVNTPEGCSATDDMVATPITGIYIPNAFTPNNDGLNDRWRIPGIEPGTGAVVTVYNRYGQQVYRVEDAAVNWDGNSNGKPLPVGQYIYVVDYKNGKPSEKGTIMLIR